MVPTLKSLANTGELRYSPVPEHAPFYVLDALRNIPLILPQLEELDARFKFDQSDRDKIYQVFRDVVGVRKGRVNKICVSVGLSDELIEFLRANVPCVLVSHHR
jgi:hypothetical protein